MINSTNAVSQSNYPLPNNAAAANSSESIFSEVLTAANNRYETDLNSIFQRASQQYGVPLDLLAAIAKVESNFDPNATSPCGAMGLMQLMPGTAAGLGVSDPYDPEQNVMGGAKYISQMLDRYDGDIQLALAAYNAGPGNVDKYGGIPPFAETQSYVSLVVDSLGGSVPNISVSGRSSSAGSSSISGSSDLKQFSDEISLFFLSKLFDDMKDDSDEDKKIF